MSETAIAGDARIAAVLVQRAAMGLSITSENDDRERFLAAASRLADALRVETSRERLLEASPYVVERSGRVKTLIEMVEHEAGDEPARLRLATLLLRALIWLPAAPLPAPVRQRRRDAGGLAFSRPS